MGGTKERGEEGKGRGEEGKGENGREMEEIGG